MNTFTKGIQKARPTRPASRPAPPNIYTRGLIKVSSLKQSLFRPVDSKGSYMNLYEAIKKAEFKKGDEIIDKCLENSSRLNLVLAESKLTEEERYALFMYTVEVEDPPYSVVNTALAKRSDADVKRLSGYILYLLSAMRKLDKVDNSKTLYRSIDGRHVTWESHREGNVLTWPGFTSTTTNKDTACDFGSCNNFDNPIMFVISGEYTGYDLSMFSDYRNENGKE